jgi:hypothetical protein
MTSGWSGGGLQRWRQGGYSGWPISPRAPLADQDQRVAAVRTAQWRGRGRFGLWGCSRRRRRVWGGWLPGGLFGG